MTADHLETEWETIFPCVLITDVFWVRASSFSPVHRVKVTLRQVTAAGGVSQIPTTIDFITTDPSGIAEALKPSVGIGHTRVLRRKTGDGARGHFDYRFVTAAAP